ncbi:MAG: DUF1853 family protein [Burkholderiales bacterium]|nr:DUF1853 family protein [Burkholderiales bacterium]MBI3727796.1 DUF1853 family protein [Burkholderiales bacterium]
MESAQAAFHRQWQHLHHPHVRALAWMLTVPGLLDGHDARWQGALAAATYTDRQALPEWLAGLDRNPAPLLDLLQRHPSRRLGLYAERLYEFYLNAHGLLHAHGLQVHDKGAGTIGEFDFLLQTKAGLLHLELATKFYLYHADAAAAPDLYAYLGPNLADSLGAKLHKILGQQLQLSRHPLAQQVLPQAVQSTQALVLGWLFYRDEKIVDSFTAVHGHMAGLAQDHYRGAIWTQAEVQALDFAHALLLDRLDWLAPAQVGKRMTQDKDVILNSMQTYFASAHTPLMLALMQEDQDGLEVMQEYRRGMVVPDDWFELADAVKQKRAL